MSKIRFTTSLTQACRGKDLLAVAAPKAALRKGVWKKVFPEALHGLIRRMLADTEPGPLGKVVASYTGQSRPAKVALAVLPDRLSRYASPSRSDAVAETAAKLDLASGKATLVLCLDEPGHYLPCANAVGRALPLYARRSGKKRPQGDLTLVGIDRAGKPVKPGAAMKATLEATRWAASLVDTPTSELSSADFVTESRKKLRGIKGLKISTLVGPELVRKGLGGLHGVGRCAKVAPRLLVIEHRPRGAKLSVALVGKGVVYDTGGLSLKTGGHMAGMKTDMGGAAATIGAFKALVEAGCANRLLCVIPLAENAIGPDAYRPDDILTLHSGRTVEINNTDAEGRLLLADGVSYAARVLKADVIFDAATLTGAQLLATGKRHAAVVTNRAGLEELAVAAGLVSGDLTCPLPFAPEFYQAEFKSAVADMRNSVKDRMNAQTSCAGQFIYSHIEDLNVPWLHIDLAGPACPGKRGTGFGVALMAELAQQVKKTHLKK